MAEDSVSIDPHLFEVYIEKAEVQRLVKDVARQVNAKFTGQKLLLIGVLNGAFSFMGDLVKYLKVDCEISFVKVSSYQGIQSSGVINMQLDFSDRIAEQTVLIVEDIIDSGLTIEFLMARALEKGAKSVAVATLFYKPHSLKTNFDIDFVGKELGDDFIIGYGMDYNEQGRNLQHIYRKV